MADLEAPPVGSDHGISNDLIATPAGGGGTGAGSDLIDNTRNRTLVIIKNGGLGSTTVTISKQTSTRPSDGPIGTYPAEAVTDIVKTIAPGASAWWYGLPNGYNDASGKLHIAYSEIEDVEVSANEIM